MKYGIALLLFTLSFLSHASITFQDAKKQARLLWADHRETLYCHCPYDKHGNILYRQCEYQPEDTRRARRIEWEHVVPASWFGHDRACWSKPLCKTKKGKRYKGRNCCEKIDPEFREMYTDLHNLVPVIGELNNARGAYKFGALRDKISLSSSPYAACGIIISDHDKTMEPCDEDKGLIARVVLYMHSQYGIVVKPHEKEMFLRWNQAYPPTYWEQTWNERVRYVQNKDNIYISNYPNIPEGIK